MLLGTKRLWNYVYEKNAVRIQEKFSDIIQRKQSKHQTKFIIVRTLQKITFLNFSNSNNIIDNHLVKNYLVLQ